VLNLAGLDFQRQFRTRLSSTLSRLTIAVLFAIGPNMIVLTKSHCIAHSLAWFLLLCLLSGCQSYDALLESRHEEWQSEMNPIIDRVDSFITKFGRIPGSEEFEDLVGLEHHGCKLVADSDIVRELGGIADNDYILANWVGEWSYCYRSWDKIYFDDLNDSVSNN